MLKLPKPHLAEKKLLDITNCIAVVFYLTLAVTLILMSQNNFSEFIQNSLASPDYNFKDFTIRKSKGFGRIAELFGKPPFGWLDRLVPT